MPRVRMYVCCTAANTQHCPYFAGFSPFFFHWSMMSIVEDHDPAESELQCNRSLSWQANSMALKPFGFGHTWLNTAGEALKPAPVENTCGFGSRGLP